MFKKKKIVLTSVLALAGVSLATVGFATWVVGLQKQTEDLTVQAIVDDSFNKSVYLEAKTKTAPVVVAEKEAHIATGNEIVSAEVNDSSSEIKVDENALSFEFEKLQYSVGKNLLPSAAEYPQFMTIELINKDGDINHVKKENCKLDASYRTVPESDPTTYHYLSFKETIELNSTNVTEETPINATYKVCKLVKTKFVFSWGNYFEGKSPVTFYNLKSTAKATSFKGDLSAELFADSEKANLELQAMKNSLTGADKVLKIKVSLSHENPNA